MSRIPADKVRANPCGTKLVRLRDLDPNVRVHAAMLAAREAKDRRERYRIFELALDPGDAGGRIAA